MNNSHSLETWSTALLQAQFLPTQRSLTGLGPAWISQKWGAAEPARRALSTVASLDSSSTTSTDQSRQGG